MPNLDSEPEGNFGNFGRLRMRRVRCRPGSPRCSRSIEVPLPSNNLAGGNTIIAIGTPPETGLMEMGSCREALQRWQRNRWHCPHGPAVFRLVRLSPMARLA
jgi:hypothetical protein